MVGTFTRTILYFAVIPSVEDRDPFWAVKLDSKQTLGQSSKQIIGQTAKHSKGTQSKLMYEDIELPKNSGMGLIIASFAFLVGFGLIWHIWWLAGLGLLGIIVGIILRASNDDVDIRFQQPRLPS